MNSIGDRLARVCDRITVAEQAAQRPAGSVLLLAVSKTRPAADILTALQHGQHRFGESYVQEALEKIQALTGQKIDWHFIGPLQSNKTRAVAEHFQWCHSIDRLKIAQRLSDQRPDALPPLNVCLQVNISGESSKSGLRLNEVPELAHQVATLPRLRLRGLMAIPAKEPDPEKQRAAFRQLRELYEQLRAEGLPLDTLSMGMTNDLEAAILEGSTLVRVGTGVFGEREPK